MTLYRAIAKVRAIVWRGSGRGVRITPRGVGVFAGALLVQLFTGEIVGWIRRGHQLGGLAALLVYVVLIGGAWLAVSLQLPHREVRWPALVPGAVLFGIGLLFVNAFNVYVTTRWWIFLVIGAGRLPPLPAHKGSMPAKQRAWSDQPCSRNGRGR